VADASCANDRVAQERDPPTLQIKGPKLLLNQHPCQAIRRVGRGASTAPKINWHVL